MIGITECPAGAVDLHCHVLPGIDDGARDLDDAVAMAVQAQDDGIGAICATPHIRHDHDVRIGELPGRVTALREAIAVAGCKTRVLPGGEVAATILHALSDAELAAVSLGGGRRWILLEPAPGPIDDRFEQAVASLETRGFRAVVAHPERHLGHDLLHRLERIVSRGALVQATAAFLADSGTRGGMLELARAGLIHVLGSDAHSSRVGRPVALRPALAVLSAVEPVAANLEWVAVTAPSAIVAGEELEAPWVARA